MRRVAVVSAAVGAAAGAVVAWFARQLLHLHDPGLSDHDHHRGTPAGG